MTRTQKTPRQRAEEQLATAERAVTKLTKKAKALRSELEDVEREQRAATARRDHLKKHPDLTPIPGGSTTTSTASRAGTNATGGNAA